MMEETTGSAAAADGLVGVEERVEEGLVVPQKMARTESFPFRMMHSFPPNSFGPTFYNGSDCRSSDLYDVAGSAAAAAAGARILQPFPTAFKSTGVGMASSLRYPFTSAQWQELERQALIYKYMMASVPVPLEFLIPISSRSLTDVSAAVTSHANMGRTSFLNLRFSNTTDPEPGRCRRTDGKKWRCSRDVAPDQKYCERHMHRGRPRSRKPVEVSTQNHTRPTPISSATTTNTNPSLSDLVTTAASSHAVSKTYHQTSGFFPKPDSRLPFQDMVSTAAVKEPRYLDPMAANQQWQPMNAKIGMRTSSNGSANDPVLQPYEDHLNLNFVDFSSGVSEAEQNDQCCLYLNTDLTSLGEPGSDNRQHSRQFIDAWSITPRESPTAATTTTIAANSNKSSVSKEENHSISSLTLSMPSCHSTAGEDMDQIQMGLSVNDSYRDNGCVKSQPSSWINTVPWLSSTPLGGPLGEVLQSRTAACSNSATHGSSKSSCGGLNLLSDGANPLERPSRLDASPSCVLQKTLASLSDSSTSSSPTFAGAKSETALQWLCHGKLSSS